jgi:hypothetical protein
VKEKPESDVGAAKKPYTKPAVAKVPLAPEEAVLGACKSPSARGPVQTPCNRFLMCRTLGS